MRVVHLRLRSEAALCGDPIVEPASESLHNVTCAACLSVATDIVHAARFSKRTTHGH